MLIRQIVKNIRVARTMMSGSALERIIENNLKNNKNAERTLEAFKRGLCSVKDKHIHHEIGKQQLIELETDNGKEQIPVLNQQTSGVQAEASAETSVAQEFLHPEDKPKKQKKVKPKKEKTDVIDVSRFDMRVGKIIEVGKHPDADLLYLLKIDCGEVVPRNVVSGLVKHVPNEEMQNRMVVVLCNVKPAKMRGVTSEAMVMCASTPDKVEIMSPPDGAVPGDLISCEGFPRNPDPIMNPKKKIFETILQDLMVNDDLEGTYKGAALIVEGKGSMKSKTLKNVNIK